MNWMGRAHQKTFKGGNPRAHGRGGRGGFQRAFQAGILSDGGYEDIPTLTNRSDDGKRYCPVIDMVKDFPGGSALALQLSHQMEIDKVVPRVCYSSLDNNEGNSCSLSPSGVGDGVDDLDDDQMSSIFVPPSSFSCPVTTPTSNPRSLIPALPNVDEDDEEKKSVAAEDEAVVPCSKAY